MSVFVCNSSIKTGKNEGSMMSGNGLNRKSWLIFSLLLLLLAVLAFYIAQQLRVVQADTTPSDLQELRATLLADPASLRGNWLRTLNPKVQDVQGDIVWNSAQQQGVMRILNLPKPPSGSYYQLWLFDTQKSADEAVSGAVLRQGVGDEELLTPIEPGEEVLEPYKFELHLQHTDATLESQILLMVQP